MKITKSFGSFITYVDEFAKYTTKSNRSSIFQLSDYWMKQSYSWICWIQEWNIWTTQMHALDSYMDHNAPICPLHSLSYPNFRSTISIGWSKLAWREKKVIPSLATINWCIQPLLCKNLNKVETRILLIYIYNWTYNYYCMYNKN